MRPKRIRCRCCNRLMAREPYKCGDAIRRPAPNAGHCLDCHPRGQGKRRASDYGGAYPGQPKCLWRGCQPASAIVKLASVVQR